MPVLLLVASLFVLFQSGARWGFACICFVLAGGTALFLGAWALLVGNTPVGVVLLLLAAFCVYFIRDLKARRREAEFIAYDNWVHDRPPPPAPRTRRHGAAMQPGFRSRPFV